MKKKVAFIIRGFGKDVPNDPYPLWWKFTRKLAKEKDVDKVVILSPLTSGKATHSNGITVIPTGKNPLKLALELKKDKYEEIYIVGSYLSALIYIFLSGRTVRKKVYLMRNRILWKEYWPVIRKYPQALSAYYILSTFDLGFIYQFLKEKWNIATFIFPTQNSADAFAKDAKVDPKTCLSLPSPLRLKKRAIKKSQKQKWIVYAGRMSRLRGVDILIQAFEKMHQKNTNLKLMLLLLNNTEKVFLDEKLMKLSNKSYLVKTGKLDDREYLEMLSQADVFVDPYSFSYTTVARPATVLEAMTLGIPTVIADVINDDFFKDGDNCLKFKTMDARNLQKKAELTLKDKRLRNKIVENGQKALINNKFDDNYRRIIQL